MPAWQATCGISSLPIESGEEVMLQLIHFHTTTMSYAENTASQAKAASLASPFMIPLSGTYNGYGSIITSTDIVTASVFRALKNKAARGEFHIDNDGSIVTKWAMEEIIDAIHFGKCSMATGESGVCTPLGFMLFKKEIYQAVAIYAEQAKLVFSEFKFENVRLSRKDSEFRKQLTWKYPSLLDLLDVERLSDSVTMFIFFAEIFEKLRRGWAPQYGKFSNESHLQAHLFLADYILARFSPGSARIP